LTDRTFLSFTGTKYTSSYHLFAGGLDWSRPVGILIYADGSGEYGLKNPTSTYLLGGTNGLVNVAKQRNMVLLTPLSPNRACADGAGSCWYMGDPEGYAKWAFELVQSVYRQYNIDTSRVAFGGYSSGAQWTTEFFGPRYGSQIMSDGVAVALSYGGTPQVAPSFTDSHRANVPYVWDTGDQDPAYTTTSPYGVKAGYSWYTRNGFETELHVVAGLGHARSDFGAVMAREIDEHIMGSASTSLVTQPVPAPFTVTIEPTSTGGRFTVVVPAGSPTTTVRVSRDFTSSVGYYLTTRSTGTPTLTFTQLNPATTYQYRVESGAPENIVATGSFTTLR
jgi:hypothetical protein